LAQSWTVANRVGSRIIDLLNEELDAMRSSHQIDSVQLFVGLLTAMLDFLKSSDSIEPKPDCIIALEAALIVCMEQVASQ
jgi:hypothetical protein